MSGKYDNLDPKIIEMFWARVNKIENGCWLWTGRTGTKGHPIIRKHKNYVEIEYSVRRISAKLHNVSFLEDEPIHPRTCGNQICVNPSHLVTGDLARFWRRINKTPTEKGCLEWMAGKDKNGYGKFRICEKDKTMDVRSHIHMYELHHGPINDPLMCVCHTCDNPSCVNIEHLFLGTNQENTQDKVSKNRQAKGMKSGTRKLDDLKVQEIRKLRSAISVKQLSDLYQVSIPTIRCAINRKTWKHVP